MVAEISTASTAQSSGAAQVGQSAAAAESLKQQARQLVQSVAAFKVPATA